MISKLFIPVKPIPASRPRISRYGNYYAKTYMDFRKEIFQFFKTIQHKYEAVDNIKFEIKIDIICKRPKKLSNDYPRGDLDNYLKAYMDSITYAQIAWVDDIQVTQIKATKRYQDEGEDYGAYVTIKQLT